MRRAVAFAASTLILAALTASTAGALSTPTRLAPAAGGDRIGATPSQVRSVLGRDYSVSLSGPGVTWLYERRGRRPSAVAIRFQAGRVVAIIRLGRTGR